MLPFVAGILTTSTGFYLAQRKVRSDAEYYANKLDIAGRRIVASVSPDEAVSLFTDSRLFIFQAAAVPKNTIKETHIQQMIREWSNSTSKSDSISPWNDLVRTAGKLITGRF
jgi:hypothetical protein